MAKTTKTTEEKIREHAALSIAERMHEYDGMNAATLRKAATKLGVKNASRQRKNDLLRAIAEIVIPEVENAVREAFAKDASDALNEIVERQEKDAHGEIGDPKPEPKKSAKRVRPIRSGDYVKTPEGYNGIVKGDATETATGPVVTVVLENAVTASGGADYAVSALRLRRFKGQNLPSNRPLPQLRAEHAADLHKKALTRCPLCAAAKDANEQIDRIGKASADEERAWGATIAVIGHRKARNFAEVARAAGFRVSAKLDMASDTLTVQAEKDGNVISLVWEGRNYIAKRSEYSDAKGRRQLRNASAAVKAIAAIG